MNLDKGRQQSVLLFNQSTKKAWGLNTHGYISARKIVLCLLHIIIVNARRIIDDQKANINCDQFVHTIAFSKVQEELQWQKSNRAVHE